MLNCPLSMDSIASCAFGVDAQSFSNRDTKFVQNAREIFRRKLVDGLKFLGLMMPGGRGAIQRTF